MEKLYETLERARSPTGLLTATRRNAIHPERSVHHTSAMLAFLSLRTCRFGCWFGLCWFGCCFVLSVGKWEVFGRMFEAMHISQILGSCPTTCVDIPPAEEIMCVIINPYSLGVECWQYILLTPCGRMIAAAC